MSEHDTIAVNESNWQVEVKDSKLPVLVDFWASWCGPCRALAPVLEEVAGELAGKLKVAKVDVDDNANLAAQFQVRSIPTLLLFVGGTVKAQMVGAMNKATLKSKLAEHL